jgi:pimeloyl-ACP methyl ester carboxylesterase
MTPVPAELLALAGERVEFSGQGRNVGRLGGYFGQPSGPVNPAWPPLLLVHSMNASGSAAEMRPLYEHARQTRAVLAIDLPGFGLSERSDRAYTPRLMSDAVHAAGAWLKQRQGVSAIDAVALSLSCEFQARAAVEDPPSWRRLALVSPTGFRGGKRRYAPAGGSVGPPWLLRALQGPGSRGWGAALFNGLTRPGVVRYFLERTWGSPQIDEALWRYDLVTTRQPGAHHAPLHFLGAVLFSTDVNALYEQLAQPVWMSHGTRGDFTDYRGKHTVQNRPNWRISVFKDTGALMYFEQPAAFCAELDQFLS